MAVGHQFIFLFIATVGFGGSSNADSEPQFAAAIPNITVLAGKDVTFPCVVDSLGKYKVAWLQADRNSVLTIQYHVITKDPRFQVFYTKDFRTWSLQIKNASVSDSGRYMCQVNTSPMKDLVGILKVFAVPKIWIPNQQVGASIGSDVFLECNLESNPKSLTYWTRDSDGLRIISDAKYNSILTDIGIHKVQMILTIKNLRLEDFGNYTCVAINPLDSTEGTITLYGRAQYLEYGDLGEKNSPPPFGVVSGSEKGNGQDPGLRWMWTTLVTIAGYFFFGL